MADGQTATNPQTGEKVVLQGGQWVPLASQQAPQAQPQAAPRRSGTPFPGDPRSTIQSLVPGANFTSGWRTPERNRAVGGATRSNHLTGHALDITPPAGMNMQALERALRGSGLPFRELLNEGDHVHIAWNGDPLSNTPNPAPQAQAPIVPGPVDQQQADQALFDQAPEVVVDQAVQNVNGRAVLVGGNQPVDLGPFDEWQAEQNRKLAENDAVSARMADPAYQAAYADAQAKSANVPNPLRSVTRGATSGFLDEILGGVNQVSVMGRNALAQAQGQDIQYGSGIAAQAARDAERAAQAQYDREHPVASLGYQVLGGLATPGLKSSGEFIAAGTGAGRLARAGAVGAGYGAVAGLGNSEGNLAERAPGTASGALVGAGTGVVGQGVLDRVLRGRAPAAGSAARRLSRQGVNLTPGQMASEVPVVGDTVKYVEDIVGGFNPLMSGVRRRQNEDVVRAAGTEALSSIGEQLPRDARTGYQVSQAVTRAMGNAYDEVLPQISAQADDVLANEFADMTRRAGETLDDSRLGRLQRVLDQNILSRFGEDGSLSGEEFKRIETTLRQQSERASRPNSTLEDQDLSEFLDETRDIVRNLVARQNPDQAARIQAINRGYAVSKRIQRAVSGSAQAGREGTPTPGELTQTVRQMSSDSQMAGQTGLLQQLASDARTVLPSGVGDTGSGQRAVIGGALGVAGTGGIATINPALAAAIAGGAVIYSRPGIAALNAVYRATDSQAASELVRQLARLAQRDPALVPYYEAAAQHVLRLGQTDRPEAQQALPSGQAPTQVQ